MSANNWLLLIASPFIGSFVASIAERLPQSRPIVGGRSSCSDCAHILGPSDLLPIVSWVWLRGRCRYCASSIPLMLPLVEIASIAMVIWTIVEVDAWILWPTIVLGWSLITLAVMDFRFLVLLDTITIGLIPAGLAISAAISSAQLTDGVIGVIAGGGFLWLLRKSYMSWRWVEGVGSGDVKLLAAAGAWTGWQGLPSVVMIASLSALLVTFIAGSRHQPPVRQHRVPFGSYLCLGFWITWLHGPIAFG